MFLLPPAARAVSPLTVDDADTVEPRRLQLNGLWDLAGAGADSHHVWLLNPVTGLAPGIEFGAAFGYQRLDARDPEADARGITDLYLSSKLRLWRLDEERFRIAARLDVKAPTASRDDGLGTGDTDLGAVLIATHRLGRMELDLNAGYTVAGLSAGVWSDDGWLVGLAARHELGARWTLIGETYGLIPSGGAEADATFHGNAGLQFSVRENLLLSALGGSGAGQGAPDYRLILGFTVEW